MYLDSAKKEEIFGKFGKGTTDTGSAESQIALFSFRISHLTEHMKQNRKDHSTERALTGLVGKRRALLNYLKARDINRYRAIVKALGLRKSKTWPPPCSPFGGELRAVTFLKVKSYEVRSAHLMLRFSLSYSLKNITVIVIDFRL